jgi:hypothetical protein
MTTRNNGSKRVLMFSDFIAAAYGACGTRGAKGLVGLAVNEHLVMFRGWQRFVVSEE